MSHSHAEIVDNCSVQHVLAYLVRRNVDLATVRPPRITQVFRPGDGWQPDQRPLTDRVARSLKRSGATGVAVQVAGRTIDFTAQELVS